MTIIDTPKHLYSDTPPTILRNRKEKFRTAKDVPFWLFIADYVFPRMIEARFHSLMYKGIENIDKAREPLYTSKPNLERSGMGFTIMESFMDEVNIESIVGLGTKVTMKKKIKLLKKESEEELKNNLLFT